MRDFSANGVDYDNNLVMNEPPISLLAPIGGIVVDRYDWNINS